MNCPGFLGKLDRTIADNLGFAEKKYSRMRNSRNSPFSNNSSVGDNPTLRVLLILRQPHYPGNPTLSLIPYVRCNVHLVDLQVAELYGSRTVDVNHIG
jgi:hypothetical protein